MTRVVSTVRRNAREHLRLAWDEYEGHAYLDLKIFYEDGSDLKPTKRGVTVRPDQLAQLVEDLEGAAMLGRQLGLLPKEAA